MGLLRAGGWHEQAPNQKSPAGEAHQIYARPGTGTQGEVGDRAQGCSRQESEKVTRAQEGPSTQGALHSLAPPPRPRQEPWVSRASQRGRKHRR